MELVTLLTACALNVSSDLLEPLIQLESGYNPYAIGVVGASVPQPTSINDFWQTINDLEKRNKNYSVGLAQINIKNLHRFNIPVLDAVEPCNNIKLSSVILKDCYSNYQDIGKALSCYYSGNDKTGFKRDFNNSYVERFLTSYANKQENVVINFDYDQFYQLKNQVENYHHNQPSTQIARSSNVKNTNQVKNFSNHKKKESFLKKTINMN